MRAVRGPTLSLRHLLMLLTAIGLLPLALLGSWSIHRAAEHRLEEQQRNLLDLARALSSAVDAELDGTVARLSGLTRMPALRLIALTGYGQPADVRRATEAGFDAHLTKPATVDDLRRALDPAAVAIR